MNVDKAIDRAALGIALCLPLLPAGPAYFGIEAQPWLHAAFGLLLLLAVVSLAMRAERVTAPPGEATPAVVGLLGPVWALFAAAAIGAGIVGLAAANDLGSPLFRRHLLDAGRLFGAIDRQWDPLYSLQVMLFVLEGFLAYVSVRALCLSAVDPRRRATAVLRGWCYGFGVVAAFAVVQYLTRFRLHPFWVEVNPNLTRSHSTLDDPNALGSFMALGTLLLAGIAMASEGRRRTGATALAMLGGAGLAASASRAAIGGLLVAGLVGIALPGSGDDSTLRTRARLAARALLLVGIGLVFVSLVARWTIDFEPLPYRPDSVVEAVTSVLDPRIPLADLSEQRGTWWSAALGMTRDAPVFGVGLGRYPLLLPTFSGSAGALDAHNLFLQVLAEMGTTGLLTLCAFLGVVFATLDGLRRRGTGPGDRLAGAALLGSIAYVTTFVTGHPLLVPAGQLLWAAMLAAVVVFATHEELSAGSVATEQKVASPPPEATTTLAVAARRRRIGATTAVCFGLVALYAAAAALTPSVATRPPWGYSHGLFSQEVALDGRDFRWTGGRAVLQLQPPTGATSVRVEVAVAPAMRAGRPTRVRISLDRNGSGSNAPDRRDFNERRVLEDTAYEVSFELEADHRFGEFVFVRIEVDPTFAPSRTGPSLDHRELGIRLFAPDFTGDERR